MNVRQLVAKLSSQGYKINYYIRPDGGIRITKIDGTSYPSSGGAGNQAARLLAGAFLSVKQKEQRQLALPQTYESHKVTKYRPKLTKREKYELRKMNKISTKVGGWKVGAREARLAKGREGSFKSVKASWRSSIRHHTGLAYIANLEGFLDTLETADEFPETQDYLRKAIDNNYHIIDEQLVRAREIWYAWSNSGENASQSHEDARAVEELRKSWSIYKEVKKLGEGWKGYSSKKKK